MDAAEFREAVAAEKRPQLDRLGSETLLVALSGGEPSPPAVLRAAAHSEYAARETFRAWADDEDRPDARAAFAATAEREADHYERVRAEIDDDGFDPADGGPMHAYLRGRTATLDRVAAGTVGRGLVSLRTHAQVVDFFASRGEERRAALFRDLRAETEAALDDGLALLGDVATDADDWARARAVAGYTVQLAYDDYADALSGLGVGPEPDG
ncbi:MAG: rubrerythrin family protein [Haloferacaceae archaeon]